MAAGWRRRGSGGGSCKSKSSYPVGLTAPTRTNSPDPCCTPLARGGGSWPAWDEFAGDGDDDVNECTGEDWRSPRPTWPYCRRSRTRTGLALEDGVGPLVCVDALGSALGVADETARSAAPAPCRRARCAERQCADAQPCVSMRRPKSLFCRTTQVLDHRSRGPTTPRRPRRSCALVAQLLLCGPSANCHERSADADHERPR